jgi:hypothetical protein
MQGTFHASLYSELFLQISDLFFEKPLIALQLYNLLFQCKYLSVLQNTISSQVGYFIFKLFLLLIAFLIVPFKFKELAQLFS